MLLRGAVINDVRTFLKKMDEEELETLTHNIRLLKERFNDQEVSEAVE